MSRGYAINIDLIGEENGVSEYKVTAGGWEQPGPKKGVGKIIINQNEKICSLVTESDWGNEEFYLPSYTELLNPKPEIFENENINKKYYWWNIRLITAINRILTNPEYKEQVWFYI